MNNRRRIYISLIIFVIIYLIGVVGFKFFGGKDWTLLDSLYMTAITISTIGYEEVIDLSANPVARVFTIVFIILSLGTIAFAVSSITAFIVEGELKNILGRRRMEKEIARLKDHYIVCGSDETAETIIQELLLTRREFVVVEPDKEKIDRLVGLGNLLYVQGDPSEDDVLLKAGIDRARGILLSLPTDEANLFVTITARSLNPRLRIVAKGIDLKSHGKMKKAGADSVISPTFIGGMRMVSEMVRPAVVTFLDMMLRDREKALRFEEVRVEKGSPLSGKAIRDAKLEEKTGALLVAIKKADTADYDFNPAGDRKIEEDDVLIFIASAEMARGIEKIAGES
ncbi:MAG: NAD-binding protein [Clostridiales bacterium]|jgi:voltage-gated potassium channel|nr:NAD-binding protein [Clostridiales bacterium]